MKGVLQAPFCRLATWVLVLCMVIQGMPLWELSKAYHLTYEPAKIHKAVNWIGDLWGPAAAEAAEPVADAGADKFLTKNQPLGSEVMLDSSGSFDPDGNPLTYRWYGPFPASSGQTPSVQIPEGTYTVSLMVNDGASNSPIDSVNIEIAPCFNLTAARAKSGKVQLTWAHQEGIKRYDIYRADESDPFKFKKIGETTSTYSTYLDETVSNETTCLYLVGAVFPGAICYSNVLSAHPTASRVRANYAPVIYSSPITHGTVGVIYNYDVNATDPNGEALNYGLFSHPSGMAIDRDTGLITWVPAEAGSFDVTVTASDGYGETGTQTFSIVAQDIAVPNTPPLANAGPDQTVFAGHTVTLDGSRSSDVDGDQLTFFWSFTSLPPGSRATLSDPAAVNPTFFVDLPGAYTVQLIVNDGIVDSIPEAMVISTQNSAPVANAGPDQTVFVTDTVQLDGSRSSDVDGDQLTFFWSFTSLPPGSRATLSDPAAVKPTFVADAPGAYVLELIVNDGALDSDPDTVTVATQNSPPVANAGPDQTVFVGHTVTLDGSRSSDVDGDALTYKWSFVSVPPGSKATLSDLTAVNPTFLVDLPGAYTVQLIVNDGIVDSSPDTVVISTQNSRPVASAGPDQTVFVGDTVTLAGTGSSDVDGDPLTYRWSFTSVPPGSGAALPDPASATPTFRVDLAGTYVLQLIVNDGALDSEPDTAVITTENRKPVANAGPDQTVNQGGTVQLDGGLSGDPDGDPLTYFWALTTAPPGSTATLATLGIRNPTFVADRAGTYIAELIVNDREFDSDPDSVEIKAVKVNRPPLITSSPLTTATEGQPYSYDVEAADPDVGDLLTYALTASPAGMTINASTGLIQWTPTNAQVGSNNVTVQVADTAGAKATQSFTISVTAAPAADYIRPVVDVTVVPSTVNVGESVAITVNASDNVGVVSRTLTVNGAPVSLDPSGTATYTSSEAGVFTAVAAARDAAGNEGSDSQEFRFLSAGDPTNPTVAISSPAENSKFSVPADIIGTASDVNLTSYKLEYSAKDKNEFITFARGKSSVTNGVLGKLDPTTLRNGLYDVRLTAEDASGNTVSTTRTYQLEGEMKVGNFTIGFNDITIPVSGIPITITRTYDSRVKTKGDFGIGWTLSIKDVEISESGVMGQDWAQTSSGGWFPRYYLQETKPHYVTVTYPDGRTDEFNMVVNPSSQLLIPILYTTASFSPKSGTFSSLVSLTDNDLISGGLGLVVLYDYGFNIYNPDRYQLTAVDGAVYIINQQTGLESIKDTNGNTITFGLGGIIHSTGKSVTFTRDAQGRITTITDPMGNTIKYEYDYYGDLVSVTDQEGNTTRFTYNSSHGLVDIIDPRGIRPARNEYDDEGRVIAHIDANGNRIEYTHNIGTKQEIVKDRLGNLTAYEYDSKGNVVSKTDTLGNTTTYTYDARGNKLTETDPLGDTTTSTYDARDNLLTQTDALGNTTIYTYNAQNKALTTTDPMGNVTANTYDAKGNFLTTTDPLGNTTTNTYDVRGNLLSAKDTLGNLTSHEYDGSGNMTKQTDPLGNVTTYTYDNNGNQLTQTATRTTSSGTETITTTNVYDGLNRLIRTIDPYGNTTITEYNAIGKQSAVRDKNGNRTEYEYDSRGNLVRTTFPDGTTETATYDPEGRKITSTDRAGRTTPYVYDALGRLTRTTYPDGSSTSTTYDVAGRIVSQTDERGNTTTYTHDAAGRRISVTDALGNTTTFTYDARGNQLTMTDANGHTTTYEYDKNNRRTKTIFHDGTFTATAYDALGRKIAETDQAGINTQFAYDALGRLISVTDALGHITRYAYDEMGNKITQTDANGHTTMWEYDKLGRVVKRTLPLGMSETMAYDAVGNLISRTDFNGDTITYIYDNNNHLMQKTYPDGSTVSLTYTTSGQRDSVADTRGVTRYAYDVRDRLLQRADTDGNTISYTYDNAGNRTSTTVPSGTTIYTFDTLNRLATVTNPDGGVTTYTYDSVGNRASVTYPNGTKAVYTYNSLNRLTRLENKRSDDSTISSYTYTLGSAGNRIKVEENTGRIVEYTYDNLYRLTEERITDFSLGNRTISYTYDPVGNRLSKVDSAGGVTNYTYDANDRLLTENGVVYTYDNNGNTISENDGLNITTYGYDYENRLIQAQTPASLMNYTYDGDGIRVSSSVDGAVTNYLVDKNRNYPQVLEERDRGYGLIASYVYGDDLVSMNRYGFTSFYHYDGNGNTRQLTDGGKNTTDTYIYDAFGNLLNQIGTTVNYYLYTGEQYDANVGFYYLRTRYYNTGIGRFITFDIYNGNSFDPKSLHKYLYCTNNPINFIDPSGQQFDMASLMTAITIVSILTNITLATYHFYKAATAATPEEAARHSFSAAMNTLGIFMAFFGGGFIGPGNSYALAGGGSVGGAVIARADWVIGSLAIPAVQLILMAVSSGGGQSGSSGGGSSGNISVKDEHVFVPKHNLDKLSPNISEQRNFLIEAVRKLANVAPKGTNPQGAFYEATVQMTSTSGTQWATTIRWFQYTNGEIMINTAFVP
jgi:RHS repeat-associated protein